MVRLSFALMLAALALPVAAQAKAPPVRGAGNFGIGLGGGTRTAGISAKYFMAENLAIQGVAGPFYGGRWGSGWNDRYDGYGTGLMLDADLLIEMPSLFTDDVVDIAWNVGPGVFVGANNDFGAVGANGVLGLEFNFQPVPIDITLEYRPSILVVPGFGIDLFSFSGHIRYFF